MGIGWRDCIVTLIDLVGAKKGAETGEASALMQRLHRLVTRELGDGSLRSVQHAYVWNDSVLVVSHVDKSALSFARALRDLQKLKKRIDNVRKSYAIAVKGQPFPQFQARTGAPSKRVTVLKASSWAMANCFVVELALKKHRASWYVDGWIVAKVGGRRPSAWKEKVVMLPKNKARTVHLYKDEPWCGEV